MHKTLITSSHRPTPNVLKFIKHLVSILPNTRYQSRGKLSLSLLALQAIDLDVEKVLVVRSRKGNPGYIDVYQVDYLGKLLVKLCTMYICGYSIGTIQTKKLNFTPKYLIVPSKIIDNIKDDEIVECILAGFSTKVCNGIPKRLSNNNMKSVVLMDIKRAAKKDFSTCDAVSVYEIEFKDLKGDVIGPVIRICKAKIYTKL